MTDVRSTRTFTGLPPPSSLFLKTEATKSTRALVILKHPLTSTHSRSSVGNDDDDDDDDDDDEGAVDLASETCRRKTATPKSVMREAPRHSSDVKRRQSTFHRVISKNKKSVAAEALIKEIRRGTKQEGEEPLVMIILRLIYVS